MAAMKGGFTFDILNYNSVSDSNNNGIATGPAGPPTPLLHEKNNFTRYPLNNCEIINLDDDLAEIQNHNTFPPFSAPAQNRPNMGSLNLMPPQQTYPYQNGTGLLNYKNVPHSTGPLGELLSNHTRLNFSNNYKTAPQTNGFETRYANYVNPPLTGQMDQRMANLGFPNPNSEYLMPAQHNYSSSSGPIRPNTGYSNSANNGMINGTTMNFSNMLNNNNNNNPHQIISPSPQHNGSGLNFSNPVTETQPPTGTNGIMTQRIEISEQQQQQQKEQEQVLVQTEEEVGTNQVSLENQGIDLNKTPQPKQRRRKYVPKVFKEKKPRAPKSVMPKPGTEVRQKRKYVRKKGIEIPGNDKPIEGPGSCTPNGGEKSVEVPSSCTPNIEAPSSCTPNGVDKPIEVPSSCTPNGGDKSIEVPNSCTQNGTSGVRKPVRRSLNFDQEELNPNAYNNNSVNNTNNMSNNISQPNLGTIPVPPPSTGTGTKINVSTVPVSVPNSSVRAKGFSLDLNQSTNQIQEEFDRTFPPVAQKTGTNQNGTNRVQNGSGINFSGYPYPSMPNVRPNNHMINNNSMVNMPNVRPNGLMALAMKNEHLLKTLGNYTRVNNHLISTSGVKRDHSNILLQNGNNNSARMGDGQKKMRITDQNNNNNISHQNGTVRPNSSNPNSSSVALHNVGPTGGVFSLADIQRITEIRKRQNPQAQYNGTPATISPTTTVASCQVATPDRPTFWFDRSEPGPSNPVPITNNNINNSRPSQVNQVYNKPPPVANSIQTYSEKTTTINQHSNNPSIITTEISPAQQKPEPKRRGRQKKDKQILSDPFSTTPPAKEKPGPKPRGRKPASLINSLATSALSFEATIESIIQKMKLLDINRATQNFPVQSSPYQSSAMVPYNNGMSGTMVQYENVEKKKRKFRVRVDLDPVTNHVWNLLMGKEMNEEPLDENKEKVLEEEREIFKGRIDSFIARMHLVQGDRRFSPWKGSVVDSVVGVFLTQNVSDHLSSSAFMGLVSKYPPQNRPVNPERETSLSIRSVISLRNFHKNVITIEDFSEEKDESNSSQDSSTKCTQPHLQETNNNNINVKPAAESSPDSGPGSIEDQNSVVSSQNSVVSSQNSTEDLNGSNGSGWLYDLDPFNALHTSYTQLLQFAESNRCDLFPDLNKVTNAMGASCSYSNNVGFYSQNGNSDCSAFPSGTMNNLSLGYSHPHNGNNYSDSVMPGLFKGNNTTGISEASHNLNLDMGISTPRSPVANQTCAQPITPMVKINQNPPNRNEYTSNTKPPASETPHNVSNASSTIASETVPNFSNNPSKTASETVQAASVNVHNFLSNSPRTAQATVQNSNAASVTVQNAPINKVASQTVQNAPINNNKAASESVQNAPSNSNKAASETVQKTMDGGTIISEGVSSNNIPNNKPKRASSKAAKSTFDWDSLRRGVRPPGTPKQERSYKAADSLDYEALRRASVRELSDAIRERGMNNMLAERIKDFLERLVRDHGSVNLEWLRDVDPGKAKDYLLSVRGLGLKSVECVRLLTLHHLAFPVDTNVGRICVRLGWVPLQPLPESLQLHLLEMYPILENIQKYLWPRLCKLDQRTLYELHYQMITFGKVFCTKSKPNCNACPMRAECKHFASAFASARLALPGPEEKGLIASTSTSSNPNPNPNPNIPSSSTSNWTPPFHPSSSHPPQILPNRTAPFYPSSSTPNMTPPFRPSIHPQLPLPSISTPNWTPPAHSTQPIIEEPASPEPEPEQPFEDAFLEEEEEDPDEIPTIKLDFEEFKKNLKSYIKRNNLEVGEADMSKALVAISPEKASLPTPKLKNISRLRTEHQVYELPDNHELLAGYERREPDDPCPYLLSIWTPGETAVSTDPPKSLCISQDVNELCDKEACLRCVGIKEARRQVVRGTVLIPCRTAMRGSFPLNGTYFQVNELFADHESSRNPVECPRGWIWNLPRRTVYFGTSIPTIFKGLSTEEIQHCFWRGFVCVRGFDRATRAPRPLYARLHFPASKLNKNGKKAAKEED